MKRGSMLVLSFPMLDGGEEIGEKTDYKKEEIF